MSKKAIEREAKAIDLYPLPDLWKWVTVNDTGAYQRNAIVDGPFGSNLKVVDYVEDGPVPVLTTKNLEGHYNDVRYISQKKFEELKRSAVYPGDILMAKIGSCGKTGIYPPNMPPAMIPANLLKVTLNENFDLKYVYYYFNSYFFQKALKTITKATAQPAFSITNFKTLPLPYTSLNKQKLIVSEIEKQFSRLDEAVAALKRIKANLKRYKASVLKAAVEGKLTEEWRKEHPDVEPASELLKRILVERKKKWEKEHPGKKYKEPVAPDTSNLPELPKGWVWASLNIVCSKIQDGSHFSPKVQYNVPGENRYLYITAKNIREHGMDISDVTYIDESFHKSIFERCNPEKGDVLLVKDGVKTGIAAINILDEEFSLLSSVALFKPYKTILNSLYLKHSFSSPVGFKMITGQMTGTAIKRIILDKIRLSRIPLPPVLEQQKIVEEIESRFSVADEIETSVETNLKRAERLRQAILKKAFEGRLIKGGTNTR